MSQIAQPPVVTTVSDVRAMIRNWRRAGLSVGLVPTMGALHRGHLSLVETARQHIDRVIVSVFVNPKQFGEHEDFDAYPRELGKDGDKLAAVGADAIYSPGPDTMYPEGYATLIRVEGISEGLEALARPTHFDGVATVVAKLLLQTMPDAAVFGEKDYQQLALVKQLALDLDLQTKIIGAPTVRDDDGLALSSRNVYLSDAERKIALGLPKALDEAVQLFESGASADDVSDHIERVMLAAGFNTVDYAAVRDAVTLKPVNTRERAVRILAAGAIGRTRLLDNRHVPEIAKPASKVSKKKLKSISKADAAAPRKNKNRSQPSSVDAA
ncbi:MAG: pantoate--beta-alanine ligase [Pseudomonadota bacterium]